MSGLCRLFIALGSLAVLLSISTVRSATGGGKLDSPEAKLRARIADLHAEVALLDVECTASRQNLLENLKKLGQLELGDRKAELSKLGDELRQARMAGMLMGAKVGGDSGELLKKMERDGVKSGNKQQIEDFRLFSRFMKGGDDSEKAITSMAEQEIDARLDSARAESERMKASFLKKARLLHLKKLELADAEAEYKASR
jgi:hypothetical protein